MNTSNDRTAHDAEEPPFVYGFIVGGIADAAHDGIPIFLGHTDIENQHVGMKARDFREHLAW